MNCPSRLNSIFKDLNEEELREIEKIRSCSAFNKGEKIFSEATYPKGLFCVQSGKVKVAQIGADGKEQIVHLINDGNAMGHRAIFGDDKYSCSAVAIEDVQLCFLPKIPFYKMVENNAKLALKFTKLLAEELKEAEEQITNTAQLPVRNRIAQSILSLLENYGFEQDHCTINIIVKREDLANIAGTTRESASRILTQFQKENIIYLVGKKIKLLNKTLLIEIAKKD